LPIDEEHLEHVARIEKEANRPVQDMVLEAGWALIPHIGESIAGLLHQWRTRQAFECLQALREEMARWIAKIDETKLDREWFKSNEFRALLFSVVQQLQLTADQEKVKMLARALVNSGSKVFDKEERKETFVALARLLTSQHIRALLALRAPTLQAQTEKGKYVDLQRNLQEAKEIWGAKWRDDLEGILWLERPKLYATPSNLIVLQPLVGYGLVEEELEMPELREPNISAIRDLGEVRSLIRDLLKSLQVPPSRIFSLSPLGSDFLEFMGFDTGSNTVFSTEQVEAQVSGATST
jgi:hypothetical protein